MSKDSNPISVVLVGAPGSKKSEVAFEFQKLANEDGYRDFQVIDDIPRQLEQSFNMAVGIYGGYLVNLLIAVRRFDVEYFMKQTGQNFVSVGSAIETTVHGAHNIELMSAIQSDEMQQRITREMHATTALSFLFLDTFKYSYGFYLPLPPKIELPAGVDEDDQPADEVYARAIDAGINTLFNNFGFNLPTLTGTVETMAISLLEQIKELETKRQSSPDEPDVIDASDEELLDALETLELGTGTDA